MLHNIGSIDTILSLQYRVIGSIDLITQWRGFEHEVIGSIDPITLGI